MSDKPQRKLPIFIRRQIPKPIPSRLSEEELKATINPEPEPVPAPELEPKSKSPNPKSKVVTVAEPMTTAAAEPEPPVKPEPITPEAEPAEPKRRRSRKLIRSVVPKPFTAISHFVAKPALDTWLLLLCLGLLIGTQITLIWFDRVGLLMNMVTVLALTFVALFRESLRKVAISLAIIPVAQMASSTIITHNAFQTAAVLYALILVLVLTYRYLFTLDEPVAASQLKWMGHFYGLPLMLVIGQLLGLLDYALLRHHYDFTHISLPLVFAATIIFAFAEEMLLRGLIQQQAGRVTHPIVAIVISSSLYVVLTISHGTMLSIIPAVATGVVLALVYHFKHNLVLSTAVNAASKLAYVGLVATFVLR